MGTIVKLFGEETGSPYEDAIEVHEGPVEEIVLETPTDHDDDAMRARRTQPWRGEG